MAGRGKAVFIDRDGTLNELVFDADHGVLDSPFTPDRVHVHPFAADFVAALGKAGFKTVLVTNQPGVAKGTLTERSLGEIHDRLTSDLAAGGGKLDAIYYCPHHPTGSAEGDRRFVGPCECRKPLPGMLVRAADELGIDLADSYMVGDGLTDIAAGKAAGCQTVLVASKKMELIQLATSRAETTPDIWVESLAQALEGILDQAHRFTMSASQ